MSKDGGEQGYSDFRPWIQGRTADRPVGAQPAPEPVAEVEEEPMQLPTAEDIERIQRQAQEEGFSAGYRDGLAQSKAQVQAQVQAQGKSLERLMCCLSEPFAELDAAVERELVALAIAIAKHLVRRELKTDPGQIVAVVREAIAALPVTKRHVQLHLHPEDAVLVREALSIDHDERPWRIVEEPTMTRGGCRVVTEVSQLDATVERRLGAVIAAALGTEREQDRRHNS